MTENTVRGGQRMMCIRQNRREKVIINRIYYDSVFQIIKTAVPLWQAHIKPQPLDNYSVNRHETKDKEKEHRKKETPRKINLIEDKQHEKAALFLGTLNLIRKAWSKTNIRFKLNGIK